MSESPLARSVTTCKALAHPVRLRLLAMLGAGELCVCQMTAVLELAASTVSAHLSELRAAGLVVERKTGRFVSYRRAPELPLPLTEIAAAIAADPQVQADARLVRQLRRVPVEKLCRVELDLARLGIRRPALPGPARP